MRCSWFAIAARQHACQSLFLALNVADIQRLKIGVPCTVVNLLNQIVIRSSGILLHDRFHLISGCDLEGIALGCQ